jgi:hypothetical protein
MKPLFLSGVVAGCLIGLLPASFLAAEEAASQPERQPLSLAAYVRGYIQRSNLLRQAEILVEEQEVQVARRQSRATMELSAEPAMGLHHYHYTSGAPNDTLGVGSVDAEWRYRRENGQSVSVGASTLLPTREGRVAGDIAYGVTGAYTLPLLRNRFGRQFRLEAEVEEHLRRQLQAELKGTRLALCHDAIRRYIERYVAQELLLVYRALLREKKKMWKQTSWDYHRKMITRLDLLSAKSDWIAARSREPEFVRALLAADAALKAYYPTEKDLALAEPALPTFDPGQLDRKALREEDHPQFKAIAAQQKALAKQDHLLVETNRSDLDLILSLGLDRYHHLYDPRGDRADITDVSGMVSVRYLFPIKRPDLAYQRQLRRLTHRRLDEERRHIRRELLRKARQASAVARQGEIVLRRLKQQLKVVEQQIKEAYREFRAGKLQFQNFLDHWERYQAARLEVWQTQRLIWLARADLVPLLNRMPGYCKGE